MQNVSGGGERTDLTFTVDQGDLQEALAALDGLGGRLGCRGIDADAAVAKVSVIGLGMRSHEGVAARMFQVLADHNINIQVISTSEIKISVLIAEEYLELALRALHSAYGLNAAD